MYAVKKQIKGAIGYMLQLFGLTDFATGQGVDRAGRWVNADGLTGHYRVSGNSFIKVNADGSTDILGQVAEGGQASIAFSFNNIAVVAGGALYYYNPDDGFRQITSAQVGEPIDIVWADGLFVLTDGTDLYHSAPLDEELFEPADFGNAQFRPDLTNGLGINEDNELIAFGVNTTEYFTNSALENFIYQRIGYKALKSGTMGTHCRKELNSIWYVLGRREETEPTIMAVQSGSSTEIASREIVQILGDYSHAELSGATIDAFNQNGTGFVLIHLPRHCLMFNETISKQLGVDLAWSILQS